MDDRTRAAHEGLSAHGEAVAARQRERAIELMAQDIARLWFRVGNHDRDLLARLVEPIVDHHCECAERIRAVGR